LYLFPPCALSHSFVIVLLQGEVANKMVHIIYDPSTDSFGAYFERQRGAGMAYYVGMPFQRGHGFRQRGAGLGAILQSLWRFVLPLARNAGTLLAPFAEQIGREGLATGARVLQNVSDGANLKDTLKAESREGVNNFFRRYQTGSGRRKGPRKTKRVIHKKDPYKGRSCPKIALLNNLLNGVQENRRAQR
jgi:hypothetical protein